MTSTLRAMLAGSALLLVGHPAVGAAQSRDDKAELERPEVREMRIRGVHAFPKGELQQSLATQPSSCNSLIFRVTGFCSISKSPLIYTRRYLDETEFQRDVIRAMVFYFRRGYRDAVVDTVVERLGDNGVRITLNVTEGEPTRVVASQVLDSANVLTLKEIGRELRPKVGEPLNLLVIDSTVVRMRQVLWERGYADAVLKPQAEADDSANTGVFRLEVNPKRKVTIGDIVVTGNEKVSEQTIRNSLRIESGDLFRLSEIGRSQRSLYESNLFRRAVIDTVNRTDTLGVARRVVRGMFGAGSDDDERRGRTVTSAGILDSTVGGRDSVIAGAARDSLRRDSLRLERSRLAAGTPDTVKTILVRVQEGPLREARLRAGFTTADFGQIDGLFTHHYFLGGPRRFDASLVIGNLLAQQLAKNRGFVNLANIVPENDLGRFYAPTYAASVDVRQRWFQSPRNTIGAGIFTHRRSSPGVFVDRGVGANVTFTREIAVQTPLSATYRFEVSRVEAGEVYFCVNYGVCDGPTVDALRGQQRLSPIAFTINVNRTDAPFSPTRGILGRAEAEHASAFTVSDFRYNRAFVDVAMYRPLPFRKAVGAARVRAGWVDPLASTTEAVVGGAPGDNTLQILHPRKRFYAGGSQSVRGFGENQLGPRVLTIDPEKLRGRKQDGETVTYSCSPEIPIQQCDVNAAGLKDADFIPRPLGGTTLLEGGIEVRVPIWRALVGAVFVDGAILGEGTLGSITKGTGAITPGFGVRYESPVGPIRVDLGIRPSLRERLPVITQVADSTGARTLVDMSPADGCRSAARGCREFPDPLGKQSFFTKLTNRLTLHLSIGQAF